MLLHLLNAHCCTWHVYFTSHTKHNLTHKMAACRWRHCTLSVCYTVHLQSPIQSRTRKVAMYWRRIPAWGRPTRCHC